MAEDNPFLEDTASDGREAFTDFLQTIVIALGVSLVLYLVFLVPSIVDGTSMEPNFYDKELLFANKTVEWLGDKSIGQKFNYDYHRGDVVIFSHPPDNLIKRVIAVEGDLVRLSDGDVYVNGKKLKETYLPEGRKSYLPTQRNATMEEDETIKVPDGKYFVMGDNRLVSHDSRYADIGFVDRKQLKGRVFLRYWPITRFKIFSTGKYEELDPATDNE